MTRNKYFVFLFILFFITGCIFTKYEFDDTENNRKDNYKGEYLISGQLTNVYGDILPDVKVKLSGDYIDSTVTDATGCFAFKNLKSGQYFVDSVKNGYIIYPESMSNLIDLTGDVTEFNLISVDYQITGEIIYINQIQGMAHISPYNNKKVTNVIGVVTGLKRKSGIGGDFQTIYLQSPYNDDELATSEAVKIWTTDDIDYSVGELLLIKEGVVKEDDTNPDDYYEKWDGNLTRTQINCSTQNIVRLSAGNRLPPAVVIGKYGRGIPKIVSDDSANGDVNDPDTLFDPENYAIDFFESLEYMRVEVRNALVVGGYNKYDEMFVSPDIGAGLDNISPRGGAVLSDMQKFPTNIIKIKKLTGAIKKSGDKINSGTIYTSPIVGIMDYGFGCYTIFSTENIANDNPYYLQTYQKEVTVIENDDEVLTVSGFNLENFSADSKQKKIEGIRETIVTNLKCPDIIGLIEVQDDSGEVDDGTVKSDETLINLISNINNKVNTDIIDYDYRYISPKNNTDGGAPGANIRVAFLFNKKRVAFIDRGSANYDDETRVVNKDGIAEISFSPGRIAPNDDSFNSTRKSIVGEFSFCNEKVFVIVNHFSSKRGDYPIFGNIQPPIFGSEPKRHKQAETVNKFVKNILTIEPGANIVMVGDYNDFHFSKTLQIVKGNELFNLIEDLPDNKRYSYNHNGVSQTLDHILISLNMAYKLPKIDIVNCFTDFGYSENVVFSDHDPVISSYKFGNTDDDITPPEWLSGYPVINSIGMNKINFSFRINERGVGYYIVLPKGEAAPTVEQIKLGVDSDNIPISLSGSKILIKNYDSKLDIKSLKSDKEYELYLVAEDNEIDPNIMKDYVKLSFKTLSSGDLIVNNSFEENDGVGTAPDSWGMKSSGSCVVTKDESYDSEYSCYFESLTTSIGGRELQSDVFPLDNSFDITISGYFKTNEPVENTKVSLKIWYFSDEEGITSASTASYTMTSVSLTSTGVWELKEYNRTKSQIPANCKSARISMRVMHVKDIGTEDSRVYFDKVSLNIKQE